MKISRRTFIGGTFAALSFAALHPIRVGNASLLTNLFGRVGKKTAPLTPIDEFYITSIDVAPEVNISEWELSIEGLVHKPLKLSYDELLKRPQTHLVATLECIGNPLGGEDIGTAKWTGVRLNTLLHEAGINSSGRDLVLHGADGYSDSFPLSRALGDEVLVALTMNEKPLPVNHGFPARVIVPGLYGLKHVKWLTKLDIVDYDYRGYWQQEGWPEDAVVKVQSRIDLPGDRETISGNQYSIQGIAFGGEYGIARVEVSTDTGKSWHPSVLQTPLSPFAWVFWNYEWTIPAKGEYTLMVCATNGRGERQEPKLGNVHAITVDVPNL